MLSIKIALAEDQILLRKALAGLLEMEKDLEVVFETDNGEDLIHQLKERPVDLVLMDIEMPGINGLEATAQLKTLRPDIHVLIVSSHEEDAMILAAIEKGAKGYLLKNAHPNEVILAIRSVMENGFYFKEDISRLLLRGIVEKDMLKSRFEPKDLLTDREKEVLQLICEEMTNNEIADKLFLSPRTVESYRKNMLEKVGARNTAGLVIFALKNDLVELR